MEVVKFFVLTCCILPRCTIIFILFQQNNSIKERKKLSKSVSFLVITFYSIIKQLRIPKIIRQHFYFPSLSNMSISLRINKKLTSYILSKGKNEISNQPNKMSNKLS